MRKGDYMTGVKEYVMEWEWWVSECMEKGDFMTGAEEYVMEWEWLMTKGESGSWSGNSE